MLPQYDCLVSKTPNTLNWVSPGIQKPSRTPEKMGSSDRSKKKAQLWKRAVIHFSLCFVTGFFTGFMPTGRTSSILHRTSLHPTEPPRAVGKLNRSLGARALIVPVAGDSTGGEKSGKELSEPNRESGVKEFSDEKKGRGAVIRASAAETTRKLLIVVTPTSGRDRFREPHLRRLATTLSLVAPPLLWIVSEARGTDAQAEVAATLRRTRVMYRHVVVKENFTDAGAEAERLRNAALRHIEHHRLAGIVHFAGLETVYDLDFFTAIRQINVVFGTWPVAFLSPNRQKVGIEGPVCNSNQVAGWHLRTNETASSSNPPIHVSNFGFNSSVLWDPERWGRTTSVQDTSQNLIEFVRQEVLKDETELRGIPPEDCSRILLWNLHFPSRLQHPLKRETQIIN